MSIPLVLPPESRRILISFESYRARVEAACAPVTDEADRLASDRALDEHLDRILWASTAKTAALVRQMVEQGWTRQGGLLVGLN